MLWIKDGCSLTSGDYERYFQIDGKRYHHIIDARSGYPAPGCSAVTILAPRLSHDYLPSVAVFLMGPDQGMALLQDHPEMAGLIITSEGRVLTTSNLSGFLDAPLPDQLDMTEAE
jgi:thiamine biosynthesis lipoprotein